MGWVVRHGNYNTGDANVNRNTTERTTLGNLNSIREIVNGLYSEDEIKEYNLLESINEHPLSHKPINIRSKLAYSEIMKALKPTKKYLLPGQLVLFNYADPKFKEELEYYDKTPCTIFCGIIRTKDNTIREIGINLHYFPPFARARILNNIYTAFKPYWQKNFNEAPDKPNLFITYEQLKHVCKTNAKIAFAIKMYIPTLRGVSYVLPAKMMSTAFYTEGHFSKATLAQIQRFWRQYR